MLSERERGNEGGREEGKEREGEGRREGGRKGGKEGGREGERERFLHRYPVKKHLRNEDTLVWPQFERMGKWVYDRMTKREQKKKRELQISQLQVTWFKQPNKRATITCIYI